MSAPPPPESEHTPPSNPLAQAAAGSVSSAPPREGARIIPLWQTFEPFLIVGLISFALGNALSYAFPPLPIAQWLWGVPCILILLGIVCLSSTRPQRRYTIRLSLWLVLLIAGCLHYGQRQFTPSPHDISQFAPRDRADIQATVEVPDHRGRMLVRVHHLNNQPAEGLLQVTLPRSHTAPPAGTRLYLEGPLKQPAENFIPGAFNLARFLATQRISATMGQPQRMNSLGQSTHPRYALQRLTDQMKTQVAETFTRTLPDPHGAVLGGIVLGERAIPLDRDTRHAFIQTGLVHFLAASGLNVGIIAGATLGLLTLFRVPLPLQLIIAMLSVAVYSMLTGLPPSIQRAATMLEIALILKFLHRQLSPTFLLCLAVVLLLLWNPENIGNIGFQFSVLTTWGIITMVPTLQERLGYYITRWLAGLILVPTIAQLWVWPLSVHYFNQFPIHSIPLNMAAVALIAPLTVLGFSAGLLSLLVQPVAEWLTLLTRPFLDGLLLLVRWGNALDWAHWQLPSPPGWMVVLLYAQWLMLLAGLHSTGLQAWPRPRQAAMILLPTLLLFISASFHHAWTQQHTTLDILPLSYRHQAYLIQPARHPYSRWLLIPDTLGYFEGRTLADHFRHRQITHLQGLIVLPQPGQRPSDQGLKTALRQTTVDTLYLGRPNAPTQAISERITHRKHLPEAGLRIQLGQSGVRLQGRGERFRLLQDQHCLLLLDIQYPTFADHCALQAIRTAHDTRLYGHAQINADSPHPHRLLMRPGQNRSHLH